MPRSIEIRVDGLGEPFRFNGRNKLHGDEAVVGQICDKNDIKDGENDSNWNRNCIIAELTTNPRVEEVEINEKNDKGDYDGDRFGDTGQFVFMHDVSIRDECQHWNQGEWELDEL